MSLIFSISDLVCALILGFMIGCWLTRRYENRRTNGISYHAGFTDGLFWGRRIGPPRFVGEDDNGPCDSEQGPA